MTRVDVWVVVAIVLVLFVLLTCAGAFAPLQALFHLVAGWIFFVGQVGSQLTLSGSGIAMGAVALALFIAGFQWLATWWTAALPVAEGTSPLRASWQWRWTLMITAAVVLSFVAGIAVVGATHQVVWMATSKEPLVDASFEAARRTQSRNNLKQIGLALHNHVDQQKRLPAGGTFDTLGRPLHSWLTAILPYVDQAALYNRINLKLPWDAPENAETMKTVVSMYLNPGVRGQENVDAAGRALSDYAANGRVLGSGAGLPLSAFKDGTSTTFISAEVNEQFRPWGDPVNWRDARLGINRSPDGFGGPWKHGAHLQMADGSVRFVSEEIDPAVLESLATPDGGEIVGEF